jgi:glycosyltransferase involved in cell wall biosynthesis
MKILFVCRNISTGGAERVIANLSNFFVASNHKVILLLTYPTLNYFQLDSKIEIVKLLTLNKIYLIDKFLKFLNVRNLIQKIKPDVVLSFPEDIAIYVTLSMIGLKIPLIVSERNDPNKNPQKIITRIIRKIAYYFPNGFIFQTQESMNYFSKRIRNKSIILKNPIILHNLEINYVSRDKKILAVGRLDKQKNYPMLIKAFQLFFNQHNDYKLVVLGDGPEKENIKKTATMLLQKDSFIFKGFVNDVESYYLSSSMLILTSNYEGFPNVLLESMGSKTPVISTNCPIGGPKNLITHGVNGFLVPINDHIFLYETMCKLITIDCKPIVENAYETYKTYDINRVGNEWLKYIEEIVGKVKKNL